MAIEMWVLATVVLGLTMYAVLGGADFGAGVWEFNTGLRASDRQRALIYRAIGPVWEANHVWLIFVIVVMFTAFPTAFAGISRALWLPLLLALAGIVFRGAAYAFHTHSPGAPRQQAAWNALFALASTMTPFFLGASVGAVAKGKLGVDAQGGFDGDYLTGWVSRLSLFTGFFTTGMCAYLAAVYLAREAQGDAELAPLWRRRALAVGVLTGVLAVAGLGIVAVDAPNLGLELRRRGWPLVALSLFAGFLSLAAVWRRRLRMASFGASTTVSTVVLGWMTAQYPYLLPPSISIQSAKAPDGVLRALLWVAVIGSLLIAPALAWLLYLFKVSRAKPDMGTPVSAGPSKPTSPRGG